jgi:hypothetical protein
MAFGASVALALPRADDAAASSAPRQATTVPVGGKILAENACYVRLPDLPEGRYGGFAAYNSMTGILAYAGGAEKRTDENTIVYHDLYALDLKDQSASWRTINYSQSTGYTRDVDRGCREMSSVMMEPGRWLSVLGKDGCAGGGSSGGDIKELRVGDAATAQGVSWAPNSGVTGSIPTELRDLKVTRAMAAWDSARSRLVFGQGTFDDAIEAESLDEIYQATQQGSKWSIRQLRPGGPVPSRRFGTCAAYVNDPAQNVDGVIVLGGQTGGPSGTSLKEVWWLDFATSAAGTWSDITARFANMDSLGYRREGACAYDPTTRQLYSWMGRASSSIPEGASRSTGIWRTDLSALGTPGAPLQWQRLAPDNLAGLKGRHLLPSVYDWVNHRVFAIAGRNDLDEWRDVWAIYPDVTGAECQSLEWWAVAPTPTASPSATGGVPATPTNTPTGPTTPGTGATPTPTVTAVTPTDAKQCDFVNGRVPQAVINFALTNKEQIGGWGQLCFPNRPRGPFNGFREYLSLRNIAKPFHPLFNGVAYQCGCP